jgi:hypothetical protein
MPPGNANAALAKRRREKLTGLAQSNSRSAIAQARWFERFLRILQWPFAWGFWVIEKKIGALDVETERRQS